MRAILLGSGLAVVLSLLGTRVAIGWFIRHGFGQPIRDDGPTTHHVKRGTPTMGGLVIIASAVAAYLLATLVTGSRPTASGWLLLLLLLGCGAVGFLDDFIKVYTQHNQGLSSRAKMAGQTLVALVFGLLATQLFADERGVRPASQYLSTTHDWGIKLPLVVALLLIWFIVTASSNGANLADGADGLLAGTAAMVFGAYAVVNFWQNNHRCGSPDVGASCYEVRDPLDLAVASAAIAAACIGFLWWNAKPAQIIMGDVGSLALGGALAGLAIMSRTELLMAVIAGLFVLETLSVLLQMSWFKLTRRVTGTGRRIFRIAPIHHHFEHLGWDEVTVVIRFWIIAGLCVVAGLGIFYADWLG
ncbi:phospho-N-acetylmuramoyl-pentapeptide-transferase [Nocardioides sp. zg-579]|uniref:Phospho-N-acetylmuramoyl-pentapeptide-transferase n=1 Tax=Nocardioides marmotae TaxID=2663857 RepID=A0A6I3J2P0_9ACTN|nr:phospho-N-acetylmuramoyl-pentapeptide-transferase [Nocardioides marmotae]MCR6031127.1 phospho-N-acetylmuramoyl-pentapeptide-transferase [Gordonia jinghuaiqii]MTB94766.1 phospho-N-acetylmuramoyl-pentapeptide-transferase [Nocardioides marmotae]QKE01237.1 phospho-N-acetylmuramoyl-pentapeptide-transferase [Nocardioides marmotae]